MKELKLITTMTVAMMVIVLMAHLIAYLIDSFISRINDDSTEVIERYLYGNVQTKTLLEQYKIDRFYIINNFLAWGFLIAAIYLLSPLPPKSVDSVYKYTVKST